jgi:hypothetical protein
MKLIVTIDVDESGVRCGATANGADAYTSCEANTLAVGALEIAKASLLAQRWGINIAGLEPVPAPLVKEPEAPNDSLRGGEAVPLESTVMQQEVK